MASSRYRDMTAEEAFSSYASWYRKIRMGFLVSAAALGIGALYALARDMHALCQLLILGIVAIGIAQMRVTPKGFNSLLQILQEDCDIAKFRRVMELFQARWRRPQVQQMTAVYLALCDMSDDEPSRALERLRGLTFDKRSARWMQVYDIQAICFHQLGDTMRRDAAVQALASFGSRFRAGSAYAREIDELLRSFSLSFGGSERWTPDDADYMRDCLAAAPNHMRRAEWQLFLAEYELVHGDVARAVALLDERTLAPMTRRLRRRREALMRRLADR